MQYEIREIENPESPDRQYEILDDGVRYAYAPNKLKAIRELYRLHEGAVTRLDRAMDEVSEAKEDVEAIQTAIDHYEGVTS